MEKSVQESLVANCASWSEIKNNKPASGCLERTRMENVNWIIKSWKGTSATSGVADAGGPSRPWPWSSMLLNEKAHHLLTAKGKLNSIATTLCLICWKGRIHNVKRKLCSAWKPETATLWEIRTDAIRVRYRVLCYRIGRRWSFVTVFLSRVWSKEEGMIFIILCFSLVSFDFWLSFV